jgi:hypothetical protein
MSSVISVTVDELKSLLSCVTEPAIKENLKLRGKLLEVAKECAECDGTGVVTVLQNLEAIYVDNVGERQEPCPQCADIRELL